MKEIEMRLPRFGYTVIQRTKDIDRDCAASYLTKRRQKKITKAVLGEQKITIEQAVIRCPRCGKETPAYPKYLDLRTDEELRIISNQEIAEWSDRQFRLFEKRPLELRFCEPVLPSKRFFCPECRMVSEESKGGLTNVRIRRKKNKIHIALLLNVDDLFTIPWVSSLQIGSVDIFESVTFNLQKHQIYLAIEDENGVQYATRDITNIPIAEIADDPVIKVLRLYKPISRAVKRFFKEKFNGILPDYIGNWNLSCCFLLTKVFGRGPVSYEITIFYGGMKFEMLVLADNTVLVRGIFLSGNK